MNAHQARELSDKNTKNKVIGVLLDYVHEKVKAQAKRGEAVLVDPLKDYTEELEVWQRTLLWQALESEGYKIKHQPERGVGCATVTW
jgi:hypothetical protein